MYRTAAHRLLLRATSATTPTLRHLSRRPSQNFCTQINSQHPFGNHQSSNETTQSHSHPISESESTAAEESRRQGNERRERVRYEDQLARVLQASLPHVLRLGWTEGAIIAGAKEVGVSPSIVGSFPRKEAALVEFFMDDCLQKIIDRIDSDEELKNLIPSKRISKLVRVRLEMQAPYISKWPQALSVQALPQNVRSSFKQRAMLVDEIWHAAGDEASDIDWYVKRTILGGIYSTTEVYMLTDNSPDFCDTWAFLDERVKDAFDLKKTIQEAKYFAEAVGSGMGNSLQGFVNQVFRA